MKVSGYTFVRNARKLGYPAVESIKSILPICDEFIVNVGDSEDDTLDIIKSIDSPKIKILNTTWNEKMLVKGFVYGQQKTIAQYNCTGDWAFYLECDEVVHEKDLDNIYASMQRHLENPRIEALVFDYYHFYGNHATYLDSPAWYRRAPRIIRNTIRTYAPGGLYFVVLAKNKKGRYPRAALANGHIYHYGWVRSEEQLNEKSRTLHKYWTGTDTDEPQLKKVYGNVDPKTVKEFKGTHPEIMKTWLPESPAEFHLNKDYKLTTRDKRQRLKIMVEKLFNIDLTKTHYRLVSK